MDLPAGIYKIADKNIKISSLHEAVHDLCREYRVADETNDTGISECESEGNVNGFESSIPIDLEVDIRPEDIEYERSVGTNKNCADSYLEELAVYRKIAEWMVSQNTFLFHGSCIALDGQGILFTARSGVGKSTHAKLWCDYLGERVENINDDKPLIHVDDSGVTIYGTPYNGKHHRGKNTAVPLKCICLLERNAENSTEEISKSEAFPYLLRQVYRPADKDAYQKTIQLLEKAAGQIKFFRIRCNMDIQAAQTAYQAIAPFL